MTLFRQGSVCVLALLLGSFILGGAPERIRTLPGMEAIDKLVEGEAESQRSAVLELAKQMTKDYSLSPAAEKAMDALRDDPTFKEEIRALGFQSNHLHGEEVEAFFDARAKYWRKTGKASEEIIGWMDLVFRPEASWYKASSYFAQLSAKRRDEYVPNMLLLSHIPSTAAEARAWVEQFKKTYQIATNEEQKVVCVATGAVISGTLIPREFAKEPLLPLDDWLEKLETRSETAMVQKKIQYLHLFISLVLMDSGKIAKYAKDSPLRVTIPMFLATKGDYLGAERALAELRKTADLSEEEKDFLRGVGPIVDSLAVEAKSKRK